jgi:hypothetical protein
VCLFNLNSEGSHCGQVAEGRAGASLGRRVTWSRDRCLSSYLSMPSRVEGRRGGNPVLGRRILAPGA